MKKVNFLTKLMKENKLKLVEPSEKIKDSYIKKSESNIASSKILLNNGRLEESVSLAYYSMYNITTALLFKVGIKCENHTGVIILLKELFNIDNSDITFAKKERIDKQYYTDFYITKNEVGEAIRIAENFNKEVFDFISKLNNQNIMNYRKKFKTLV